MKELRKNDQMTTVGRLLHHVVNGEHDAVESILKEDIHLILTRGQVTDCSGRIFGDISGFEYALWAMDKHMWVKMMSCIPQTVEGGKVCAQLMVQYDNVLTNGVTYQLNGSTVTEAHFDFKNTIINALKTQVILILTSRGILNWNVINAHWKQDVGGAQKLLPMHVVHEYCSKEPFYPVPKFSARPIASQQFYNHTTNKHEDWFSVDSLLGCTFAIHRGCKWLIGARGTSESRSTLFDYGAINALYKVRTEDLIALKSELEEQAALANHYPHKNEQKVSNRGFVELLRQSKLRLYLFKPVVDVATLLHHVVRAQYDAVRFILVDNVSLMLEKGQVTDCSGREFGNISGFEYALWAMDNHMWVTMMSCIPQSEAGKKVFAQLIVQYDKVNTDGVTYTRDGVTCTETHFDFENTLIKALQTQVDSKNTPGEKDWGAIDEQWRQGVGGAQRLLPMHIVDEFCSNTPIDPIPDFTAPARSSKQFLNWHTTQYEDWFSLDSQLGSAFAIYKVGGIHAAACLCVPPDEDRAVAALTDAMKALCDIRTEDRANLKLALEAQAVMDYRYRCTF